MGPAYLDNRAPDILQHRVEVWKLRTTKKKKPLH